jgi:hypothetical protein
VIEKAKFVEAIRLLADVVERTPDNELRDISFWSDLDLMSGGIPSGWHNLNVTVRLYRDPTEEFPL